MNLLVLEPVHAKVCRNEKRAAKNKTSHGEATNRTDFESLGQLVVRGVIVLQQEILQQMRTKAQGKAQQENFERAAQLKHRVFEQLIPTPRVETSRVGLGVIARR
jgi:excinuclease UvrABC nuclease subunit